MPLSRLRLRLTAAFAIAFALGLGLLAAGVLGYLWRESSQRLDTSLARVAREVAQSLAREMEDTPDSSIAFVAGEVVNEWPANGDAFGIIDEHGALLAGVRGVAGLDSVIHAWARNPTATRLAVSSGDQHIRAVAISVREGRSRKSGQRFRIVAFSSTEGIERDVELLGGALAIALPLIVLISLAGGYALARRALRPVSELGASIAAMAPDDLTKRLPSKEPRDEVGALAAEFNALLGRLDEAQRRNRGFVRKAAHQIRTPLTLVLGEAGHELATPAQSMERTRAALARIRNAAEQMQHRVDELFLLAEAQAGEVVQLDDTVEADGLVLECTDLMRGRASSLGQSLAIGRAEPIVVRGNAMLLKEALVELIENGCKHGARSTPITVSAYAHDGAVVLAVESAGPPFELRADDESPTPDGLGLPIVRWIARAHGGELRLQHERDLNLLGIVLPAGLATSTG